jgi:hypothetical protein
MATGLNDTGCKMVKRIVLVDGVVDAEADMETARQLTRDERVWLAAASETALVIRVSAETGSAAMTVTDVQESAGGTYYRTVASVTDTAITGVGEVRLPVAYRVMAEYVKVLIGTVTLSGSAYFTLTLALECTIDPSKYGAG